MTYDKYAPIINREIIVKSVRKKKISWLTCGQIFFLLAYCTGQNYPLSYNILKQNKKIFTC